MADFDANNIRSRFPTAAPLTPERLRHMTGLAEQEAAAQGAIKQVLVSGVAASGELHLGNYIGALRQWADLQNEYRCFWFIADLHALTVPHDIKGLDLAGTARNMAALYIACGLNPSSIFLQSDVPAHTEMNWLLACLTPTGWLDRMTQFKSKSEDRSAERISTGLYTYPVLQAADILLYRANKVPVGADQKQHVELAREIARRFNHMFGETFVEPEPLIPPTGARIMGLDNPETKMSKTIAATKAGHAIGLLDTPDRVHRTISRAQTDSGGAISFDPNISGPGVRNLLTIYQALTGRSENDVQAEFEGQGYGILKAAVTDVVVATLEPIQQDYEAIIVAPDELDALLLKGARDAAKYASVILRRTREAIGLNRTAGTRNPV